MMWIRKGLATLCDQGLISGSNFVLGVALAKWLGASKFGAYVLLYAVFLLLANIAQGILLDPMSVLEPDLFPRRRRQYLGAVLWLNLMVSAAVTALLTLTLALVLLTHHGELAGAVAGVALAFPFVLLFWVLRCGAYLDFAPAAAARASLLYAGVAISGLVIVHRFLVLSPFATFALMAAGSLVASLYLLWGRMPESPRGADPDVRTVWSRHWQYGRWSLAGVAVNWVQAYSLSLASGWILGIREAGILAALVNFVLPVNHVVMASSRLLTPRLAELRAQQGSQSLGHVVRRLSIGFFGGAAAYWTVLLFFHGPLFRALYGDKFADVAPLVPWATAYIVIWAGMYVYEMGLRAALAPEADYYVLCATAAVILAVGIPAMHWAGLMGVFRATILANLIGLVTGIALFRRRVSLRRTPETKVAGMKPDPASITC